MVATQRVNLKPCETTWAHKLDRVELTDHRGVCIGEALRCSLCRLLFHGYRVFSPSELAALYMQDRPDLILDSTREVDMQKLEEIQERLVAVSVGEHYREKTRDLIQLAIAERLETAVVQMSLMNGFLDGILTEMKKQNGDKKPTIPFLEGMEAAAKRMGAEVVKVDLSKTPTASLSSFYEGLYSPDARERDEAALGIADFDDPKSIPAIHAAIEREPSPHMKANLVQVLDQLEATRLES